MSKPVDESSIKINEKDSKWKQMKHILSISLSVLLFLPRYFLNTYKNTSKNKKMIWLKSVFIFAVLFILNNTLWNLLDPIMKFRKITLTQFNVLGMSNIKYTLPLSLSISLITIFYRYKVYWKKTLIDDRIKKSKNTGSTGEARWGELWENFRHNVPVLRSELNTKSSENIEIDGIVNSSYFVRTSGIYNTFKSELKIFRIKSTRLNSKKLKILSRKMEILFKKIFIDTNDEGQISLPESGHDVLLFVGNGGLHSGIIGSTGSGKSETIVEPTIEVLSSTGNKSKSPSIVITDPKGELFERQGAPLKKKGYDILVLNFRDPDNSSSWNPLYPIIKIVDKIHFITSESIERIQEVYKKYTKHNISKVIAKLESDISSHISDVAEALFNTSAVKGADKIWVSQAAKLLEGYIWFLIEEYQFTLKGTSKLPGDDKVTQEKISLPTISSMSARGEEPIMKYYGAYYNRDGKAVIDKDIEGQLINRQSYIRLSSWYSAPQATRGSFKMNFDDVMSVFQEATVRSIVSSSGVDLNNIAKKPTAVFVIVPDEKNTYNKLTTLFMSQLYKALVEEYNNNDMKILRKVHFLADEFANIPAIPAFTKIISIARGRGIRFHLIIQQYSQLDEVYGDKDAKSIVGQLHTTIYIKTNELTTAESISKRIGTTTLVEKSISKSTSDKSESISTSDRVQSVPLIRPEQLLNIQQWTAVLLDAKLPFQTKYVPWFLLRPAENLLLKLTHGELMMTSEQWHKKHSFNFGGFNEPVVDQELLDEVSQILSGGDVMFEDLNIGDEPEDVSDEDIQTPQNKITVKHSSNTHDKKNLFSIMNANEITNEWLIDEE